MKPITTQRSLSTVLILLAVLHGMAKADSIFTMGNSLTWDSRPALLDDDVQWHIACNRNLADAFNHPGDVCIDSSANWQTALQSTDFDYVMLQPFVGTTLAQDTEIVSAIMDLEPEASIVIHTGWPSVNNFEHVYTSRLNTNSMRPSAAYFERLINSVKQIHPGRNVASDRAVDILYAIATDIDAGHAPFASLSELYRDSNHLNETGRYVAHNAARLALGQPISDEGFHLDAATRKYLDRKILSGGSTASGVSTDTDAATSAAILQQDASDNDALFTPVLAANPVSAGTAAASKLGSSLDLAIPGPAVSSSAETDEFTPASTMVPTTMSTGSPPIGSSVPEPSAGCAGLLGLLTVLASRWHRPNAAPDPA